jgi:hypothetical protein
MEFHRLRVVNTWYFESGHYRYRIEVYEHELLGTFGFHIFENAGDGTFRLDASDSRYPGGTPPQPTPEEALAAAEDRLRQRLVYQGKIAKGA